MLNNLIKIEKKTRKSSKLPFFKKMTQFPNNMTDLKKKNGFQKKISHTSRA